MTLYRHRNKRFGVITIYDSKGKGYVLGPGHEVVIDRNSEGNGVFVTEIIEEKEETKSKKDKEVKDNDSIS